MRLGLPHGLVDPLVERFRDFNGAVVIHPIFAELVQKVNRSGAQVLLLFVVGKKGNYTPTPSTSPNPPPKTCRSWERRWRATGTFKIESPK